MKEFSEKCSKIPEIYIHKEVLCHSLEGRPMHLYTVTWDQKDCSDLKKIVGIQKFLSATPPITSAKSKPIKKGKKTSSAKGLTSAKSTKVSDPSKLIQVEENDADLS